MALRARVNGTEFAALAAAIQAEYRQDGDDYVLDVTPVNGFALEDINGLKTTLGKNKTEIANLKNQLSGFTKDGTLIDATKAMDALTQLEKLGTLNPEDLAKAKVQAAIKQVEDQFGVKLSAAEKRSESLLNNLRAVLIDQQATAALAAKNGNIKLLLPHVRSSLKLIEENGQFKVNVVDAEGNPRIHLESGKTSDMTIEQFVDEMSTSQDFAAAFAAQGRSGGGTPTNTGGSGGSAPRTIPANDQNAMNANIANIAAGKATVV